jgi:hypothetical protein
MAATKARRRENGKRWEWECEWSSSISEKGRISGDALRGMDIFCGNESHRLVLSIRKHAGFAFDVATRALVTERWQIRNGWETRKAERPEMGGS